MGAVVGLLGSIGSAVGGAATAIGGAAATAGSAIAGVAGTVGSALGGAASNLAGTVGSGLTTAGNALSSGVTAVGQKASELGNSAVDLVKGNSSPVEAAKQPVTAPAKTTPAEVVSNNAASEAKSGFSQMVGQFGNQFKDSYKNIVSIDKKTGGIDGWKTAGNVAYSVMSGSPGKSDQEKDLLLEYLLSEKQKKK